MAGTIAADTLTHSTAGSLTTDYVVNGSAKAWVNFDGTGTAVNATITPRDSLNLSVLTDLGTGNYRLAFSNAFGDGDYAYAGVGRDGATTAPCIALQSGTTPTSSSMDIVALVPNVALRDTDRLTLIAFGDLA